MTAKPALVQETDDLTPRRSASPFPPAVEPSDTPSPRASKAAGDPLVALLRDAHEAAAKSPDYWTDLAAELRKNPDALRAAVEGCA